MRQGSRDVKADVQAKRPVAGRARRTEDEEVSALKKRLAEASNRRRLWSTTTAASHSSTCRLATTR